MERTPVRSPGPRRRGLRATLQRRGGGVLEIRPYGSCTAVRTFFLSALAFGAATVTAIAGESPQSELTSRLALCAGGITLLLGSLLAAIEPRLRLDPATGTIRFLDLLHRRVPQCTLEQVLGWQYCRGTPLDGTDRTSFQGNLVVVVEERLERHLVVDTLDRVGLRELLVELCRITGKPLLEHDPRVLEGNTFPGEPPARD